MEQEVQFVLGDSEYNDDSLEAETLSIDESEFENLFGEASNQTILLKNGQAFIFQRTNEDAEVATIEEDEISEDALHVIQENEFGEPTIYKLIESDASELLQSEQDSVLILNNDEMDGINLIKEEPEMDTFVTDDPLILSNINQNNISAVLKDCKWYLQTAENEKELQVITDPNYVLALEGEKQNTKAKRRKMIMHDNMLITNGDIDVEANLEDAKLDRKVFRAKDRQAKLNQKSRKQLQSKMKTKFVGKIIDIHKSNKFESEASTSKSPIYKFNFNVKGKDKPLSKYNYSNIESLFIDGNGKLLKVLKVQRTHEDNSCLSKENINFISKTLSGLMLMVSLQKKLLYKTLYVKLAETRFNGTPEQRSKTLGYIKGFVTLETDGSFKFVELADDVEYTVKDNRDKTRKRIEESITIYKVVNSSGLVSTRVIVLKNAKANKRKPKKVQEELNRKLLSKRYHCETCSLYFSNQQDMDKHNCSHYSFAIVVGDESSDGNGEELSTVELDNATLNELVKLDGDNCNTTVTDSEMFYCKSCNKSFFNLKALNDHFASHDSVKTYVCDVCSSEFTRYANLIRHLQIHKGKGKQYICDICGCSYNYNASLTRHIVQNHI